VARRAGIFRCRAALAGEAAPHPGRGIQPFVWNRLAAPFAQAEYACLQSLESKVDLTKLRR